MNFDLFFIVLMKRVDSGWINVLVNILQIQVCIAWKCLAFTSAYEKYINTLIAHLLLIITFNESFEFLEVYSEN